MANVNSNGFTLVFAAFSCILAGALLAGASQGLKDLQDTNIQLDKQRSVLSSAGLIDETATAEDIGNWFSGENPLVKNYIIDTKTGRKDTTITTETFDKKPKSYRKQGKEMVFECTKQGQESLVLPITAKGLWGPMHGYLAVGKTGNDVLGLVFFDHKETPGLGGEVNAPYWKDQFTIKGGKKLLKTEGDFSADGFRGITVLKGKKVVDIPAEEQAYHVDGISGATITSNGVTEVLTESIFASYSKFLSLRRS